MNSIRQTSRHKRRTNAREANRVRWGPRRMNPRILLVLQDALFMDALAEKLKQQKIAVVQSDGGKGLSEILLTKSIDIVLLDARTQQKEEAMETLARVKRLDPDVEVILLGSAENIALSMEGMRKGASDDIAVPFDVDTLLSKINEAWTRIARVRDRSRGHR
jgi:DNA-binding NtrC family response regulator